MNMEVMKHVLRRDEHIFRINHAAGLIMKGDCRKHVSGVEAEKDVQSRTDGTKPIGATKINGQSPGA